MTRQGRVISRDAGSHSQHCSRCELRIARHGVTVHNRSTQHMIILLFRRALQRRHLHIGPEKKGGNVNDLPFADPGREGYAQPQTIRAPSGQLVAGQSVDAC